LRTAVIDIGTNSTRLLIADIDGTQLHELERESRVTRLGRGSETSGRLSGEAVEAVCATISDYLELVASAGVDRTAAIATSAVRDADNGSAFVAELRERFGLSARVIDGLEEARLTYAGATRGRDGAKPTLVLDIGGGSTELIVGTGAEPDFHASLQVGVVRHTERHLRSDPPSVEQLEALAADVGGELDAALAEGGRLSVEAGIAVAGTPTSLAAIELELEPYDREAVQGYPLRLERIQSLCSRLSALPLEQRRQLAGLHPDRAPTIVCGVVILITTMRALNLDCVEVSEHDILHGTALRLAAENRG
jgi:exopolyphosphatase/guanosine-5'-triphosphate,3'-diphosphate pyrophosphatase